MSERRHWPTKRRLQKARREGQVCKSPAVTALVAVTSCFCALFILPSLGRLGTPLLLEFTGLAIHADVQIVTEHLFLLALLLVVVGITPSAVLGVLAESAQLEFRFELGSEWSKPGRLSVVVGIKRLWSGLCLVWLHLLFLIVGLTVLYRFLSFAGKVFASQAAHGRVDARVLLHIVQQAGVAVVSSMMLMAFIDYSIRRYQYLRGLRMTQEELKDEFKETEGDGHLRAHRRAMQRSLASQDIASRVRRAKVIVVERACSQTEHHNS